MGIHTVTLEQLLAQASSVHHSFAHGDVEAAWHSMQQFETMAGLFRLQEPAPIDMLIFCPRCGLQHIDAAEAEDAYSKRLFESSWWELGGEKPTKWMNPPHRSHLCSGCGHKWRHCDVPTNGVASINTKGANDSPVMEPIRSPVRLLETYNMAIDDVLKLLSSCGGTESRYDAELKVRMLRRKT